MNLDDRLRDALDGAAPPAPSAAPVRARLGSAMARARRRHRLRRAAAAATVSVGLLGGAAAAVLALNGSDDVVGTADSLPVVEQTTTLPEAGPSTSRPGTVTTTPGPDPTTSDAPGSTATTMPSSTESTVPGPTSTAPGSEPVLSGPHETRCGSVTFAVSATSVAVESHTSDPGYRFTTEGEGSDEVHAKWEEGPGDECQVEAHLEHGTLEVEIPDDDLSS